MPEQDYADKIAGTLLPKANGPRAARIRAIVREQGTERWATFYKGSLPLMAKLEPNRNSARIHADYMALKHGAGYTVRRVLVVPLSADGGAPGG